MKVAAAASSNAYFVQLARDVGPKNIAEMARRLGVSRFSASWDADPATTCVSARITLGQCSVSPLDMASAYATIANHGVKPNVTPVVKVTEPDGTVVIDNTKPAGTPVLERRHRRHRDRHPPRCRRRGHRQAGRTSTGRRSARPARPTTTPTSGSSAIHLSSWPRCGRVTPTVSERSGPTPSVAKPARERGRRS